MAAKKDPKDIYKKLGVKQAISASGPTTLYGGSKLRTEVMEAMNATATMMVNMDELNKKAGEVVAEHTGAEAGMVCSGSAGGLILQAAAVIAGNDPAKMYQLPDTTGMKNEIIIHNIHRFPYDQCYRAAGAKLVGVGDYLRCLPWQLETAINEKTAAIAYLESPFVAQRAMPLEQVVEIAHKHDVPVILDAASMLPPRANLKKYIAQGVDMVVYSGGKALRGPQGTGILAGRADLVEAAYASASPHQAIGRGLKVSKEEIIGLVHALETFVNEDEAAEMRRYRQLSQMVVDALIEMPGLDVSLEHDDKDWLIPSAVIRFTREWRGPSKDEILKAMSGGDPPIYMHWLAGPGILAVDPLNVSEDEMKVLIRRLREELNKSPR
ncbi:MAG: aminotransferase class V-fold PLP-dependent enzyme [SAR202 cluster bacterium]|nr:aminotransferase class V-fold PLP-dependent enzyme [SAR202 cluster bacterium]